MRACMSECNFNIYKTDSDTLRYATLFLCFYNPLNSDKVTWTTGSLRQVGGGGGGGVSTNSTNWVYKTSQQVYICSMLQYAVCYEVMYKRELCENKTISTICLFLLH